ncbi:ABC transporter permease subunit [Chloroflexota bacterium]
MMTAKGTTSPGSTADVDVQGLSAMGDFLRAVRNGLLVVVIMAALAIFLEYALDPMIASAQVEQTVMISLARILSFLLPFIAYAACGMAMRHFAKASRPRAIITAMIAATVVFVVISIGQYVLGIGSFAPSTSLQFTLGNAEEGAVVEEIVPGGAADVAGLQVGDIIVAIRRNPVDKSSLLTTIGAAADDAPLRLRLIRDGEEMQLTAQTVTVSEVDINDLFIGLIVALIIATVTVFWPGGWTPYVVLSLILAPLLAGYIWLIVATFSSRTQGLLPLDTMGNIGGLTLSNWSFLAGEDIAGMEFTLWRITFNSFAIAISMTVVVLLVSSMTGYALSRMNFPGRKGFLSFTLILHGFPQITLLIPIFFILRYISNVPLIGDMFGFNTIGGIALAMVAWQLPLGVWLMKGFFDNIPWDMERSALIDGASRWRTYWQILLPQIRPGLLALGIFAFISGWNAYIIPQTYSVGSQASNLTVFMNQLIDETAPTDWNQVAAVGMFQLIPIFIFFIFAQEYLLNIYAGGTKGTS